MLANILREANQKADHIAREDELKQKLGINPCDRWIAIDHVGQGPADGAGGNKVVVDGIMPCLRDVNESKHRKAI